MSLCEPLLNVEFASAGGTTPVAALLSVANSTYELTVIFNASPLVAPKLARLIVVTTDAVGCTAEIHETIPTSRRRIPASKSCSAVAVVVLRRDEKFRR